MAARYVHLAGRDLDDAIVSFYGQGKAPERSRPTFVPQVCGRCGEKNTPGLNFCGKCGTPLTTDDLMKAPIQDEEARLRLESVERKLEEVLREKKEQSSLS